MPGRVFAMSAPPMDQSRVSRWISVGAFAIAAFILASGFVSASGPDGRIRGFITDSVSGGPISGAIVRIEASDLPWQFEATTDLTGFYDVAVPAHRYSLTAWSADHDQAASAVAVGSGQTVWMNESLSAAGARSARLQGYVTDASTSAPVSVGDIVAGHPWWDTGRGYVNESSLNGSGYYEMNLVPDYYEIMSHNVFGYAAYDYYSVYVGSGQILWYNISLTSNPMNAWINGTVSDASTAASIAGATVGARVDGMVLPSVVSNATGFYSLQVPGGSVEIVANALGYAPTSTSTYVWSSGQYIVNLGLTPLSYGVRGYVHDGVTGGGLPGVVVTVDPLFGSGYFDQAVTDSSGFFNIPLPPDDYVVRASASGYTTWTTWLFSFSSGAVWANATLWPIISRVSGYLVDSLDGSHVPGLGVTAIDSRAGYSTYIYADASGFFSLAVPPSPAISVAVLGQAPYAGNIVYVATHPYLTTWVNITLDRLNAQIVANVTDALTGLPISGASVYTAWYYGSDWGTSNASGAATVEAPAGATTYVSAWASGYLVWSATLTPVSGANSITIRLYPDLAQNVRIRGYVTDSVTSVGLWPATIHVTGYDDQTPYAYTDGTGYYEVWTVAAPQTVRATATGYAAGEAAVNPASGDTIWVNLSLSPDANAPLVRSFTATPSIGVSQSNPTSLVADVNETSLEQSYLSILKLHSVSGNVGTFLNLGRLDATGVSVTEPSAGNYTLSASWETRTPIGHMSDGLSSVWWPSLYAYAPFQSAVAGYWDNATLASPVPGAAVFDTRSGHLLYVYTSYGFFGPEDQPASTFSPYATGVRIDLTSAAILGYAIVNGPTFAVGSLRMDLSQTVPAGQYGALLELYDSAGHYTSAATLMQTTPDNVPPVASAGPDLVVNEDTTVTFDGSRSTDNVGIASYTWTFMDGSLQTLQGVTASYVFATPGTYIVTLTVRDADGNVGTDSLTVTVRDVTAPTVTVSSPLEGATVPGSAVIVASATDNVAVVRVEFFVDGVSVGNDTTAPFEWALAAGSLKDGNHTFTVVAYDAAGNSASSVRHVTAVNVSGGSGLGPYAVGGLIVILAAIAAVGVALILILRRKPRGPAGAPPAVTPSSAPTYAASSVSTPPEPEPPWKSSRTSTTSDAGWRRRTGPKAIETAMDVGSFVARRACPVQMLNVIATRGSARVQGSACSRGSRSGRAARPRP